MPVMNQKNEPALNQFLAHAKQKIPYGDPAYNMIMDFLIDEAFLLDEGLFNEWLELLDPDYLCSMPIRQSKSRKGGKGFSDSAFWLRDDYSATAFKIKRLLETEDAFAEDPPSRTRRIISNVRVYMSDVNDQYLVQSYIQIHRNRGNAHNFDTFSARRDDIITINTKNRSILQRTVMVDQAVLGLSNLAIFL